MNESGEDGQILPQENSNLDTTNQPDNDSTAPPFAVLAPAQSTTTTLNDVNVTDIDDIPECWTENQCNNFKLVHKWLVIKNRMLGCRPCMNMYKTEQSFADKTATSVKGPRRSTLAWSTCQVTSKARTNVSQQSTLRKKISDHTHSRFHMAAVAVEEKMDQFAIHERLIQFKNQLDKMSLLRIFAFAYNVVKCKLPFEQFSLMCSFAAAAASQLRTPFDESLTAEKCFHSILRHMATELRRSLVWRMFSPDDQKISIIMYETRIVDRKTLLAVHIKFHGIKFDERQTTDACVFLDLLPVTSRSSEEVIDSLMNCLQNANVAKEYLRTKLVSFIFEEDSTLLGSASNVAVTLSRQILAFPNVKIEYGFDAGIRQVIRDSFETIKNGVKCSTFTTSMMADAMFINMVGPPVEYFNVVEIARNWLTNDDDDEQRPEDLSKKRRSANEESKKISNDMALASEAHDEQRLVIDLRSESNSNSHQESDEIVDDSSTVSHRHSDDNLDDNSECDVVKHRKRSWRQADTKQNSQLADNDVVKKVRGSSDLCTTCNEDNDRLFLLSLLPFMKQMNTSENLAFRTEVQQLMQKKIVFK